MASLETTVICSKIGISYHILEPDPNLNQDNGKIPTDFNGAWIRSIMRAIPYVIVKVKYRLVI